MAEVSQGSNITSETTSHNALTDEILINAREVARQLGYVTREGEPSPKMVFDEERRGNIPKGQRLSRRRKRWLQSEINKVKSGEWKPAPIGGAKAVQ